MLIGLLKSWSLFTNISLVCVNHSETPETVAHILIVSTSRHILEQSACVMPIRFGQRLDTASMLTW
jgi:hypothetical protein